LRDAGKHAIVVAGESYGQGSSREHAAICPMYLGVKAVLAKSFERIHAANLVNFGIAPLVFADPSDYDAIKLDDPVHAIGLRQAIETGKDPQLNIGGRTIECRLEVSSRQRKILLAGGLLNLRNA
jgi:aconitate hydratase